MSCFFTISKAVQIRLFLGYLSFCTIVFQIQTFRNTCYCLSQPTIVLEEITKAGVEPQNFKSIHHHKTEMIKYFHCMKVGTSPLYVLLIF